MSFDASSLGQPVEFSQIPRELKKLWESSGGAKSRASLVNFAVCSHGTESLATNTELISEFTREHACRATLVACAPEAPQPAVKAWINAHCHLSRAGAKQVCCEQITILLEGATQRLLSNILFASLDSDLPLYLWWQGEFSEAINDQLWTWTDRLIYDSKEWSDPVQQFGILQNSRKHSGQRMVLCDLNWTRTLHLRQALAQTFDHPANLEQIGNIQSVTVTYAPGHWSTAVLFVSWMAGQLRWEPASGNGKLSFRAPGGSQVTCELRETAGAPIGSCELAAPELNIALRRSAGSPFHRAEVRANDGRTYQHLLPAGHDDIASLLDDELTFGGQHRVYAKALAVAEPILKKGL